MPFPLYRELCSWVSFISWSDQIKGQDQPSHSFTFCLWGSHVSRERQYLPSCGCFTHLARFAHILASIRMSFLSNTGCCSPVWSTFCFSTRWLDARFDGLPSLATVSEERCCEHRSPALSSSHCFFSVLLPACREAGNGDVAKSALAFSSSSGRNKTLSAHRCCHLNYPSFSTAPTSLLLCSNLGLPAGKHFLA